MERPRLLLVPMLTELEWVIKPLLGDEPAVEDPGSEATGRRGLQEADRRGWDSFIVVADEFGLVAASHLAVAAGDRLRGIALGHARVSNAVDGPRPALNREVLAGIQSLLRTDPRMFVLQLFKMTGGEGTEGGYAETLADDWLRRVRMEVAAPFYEARVAEGEAMAEQLASLNVPMLLAQHKGCLMFTEDGFDDAVAALPRAQVYRCNEKPSTSAEFVPVLREFCGSLAAARA
jgi:hypothetical protein